MQNVLSFIYSERGGYKFRYKHSDLHIRYLRLQVENSLRLGWKKEDIIIVTNFPFEYMDVKAHVIDRVYKWSAFANKMPCLNWAIKQGLVTDDVWYHDVDCYQLIPFEFPDVGNGCGFTRHAVGREKLQGGSSYWSKNAYDMIDAIAEGVVLFKIDKEESHFNCYFEPQWHDRKLPAYKQKFTELKNKLNICENPKKKEWYRNKALSVKKMVKFIDNNFSAYENRFKWLNYTYGLFRVHDFRKKWPQTEKPVKVVHFKAEIKNCADCFIFGVNRYNISVVDNELLKLFAKHKLLPHQQ